MSSTRVRKEEGNALASKRAPNSAPATSVVKSSTAPPPRVSKLPTGLQFPLLILLNFTWSYVLYELFSSFTRYELSGVSKKSTQDQNVQLIALLAWRMGELSVGWFGGFDDWDIASLTLATRIPYYFLLNTFYDISLLTSCLCLTLDTVSSAVPFAMMRQRSAAHVSTASMPNRNVVYDPIVIILTILAPAAIYAVIIYSSFLTWLPVHMVTYFDGVKSFEKAHKNALPSLMAAFFPLGIAARTFLFSPSSTACPDLGDARVSAFNPKTATLGETVRHNFWGWRKGWKVLLQRIAVLATMVGVATWVKVWGTVEGSEAYGALGWAALWGAASVVVGLVLGWVGEL